MTGGQQAVGNMSIPELTRMLLAEGVRRVVITTEQPRRYKRVRLAPGVEVRHRDRLISTQEELAKIPGVTVLIHDQECATELRRKRKRSKVAEPAVRAYINERVCEGCGDCGRKSNCVSVQPVETEFGRKTQIHQPSCNKDYSCLDGDCPSFLTVVPAGGSRTARTTVEPLGADSLPEPRPAGDPARFAVRITGIGGTGVVTVAQILATAATMAGRSVRALDQTGLAQKGGAVVSDIKVTASAGELSNKLSAGECDLYLGCDVLVAAAEENLSVADPARTVAVVSSSEVPTGAMVVDTTVRFPAAEDTLGRISDRTRTDAGRFVDARAVTRALFDDDQYANMFLVGVAHQLGAFPISAELIEQAIALNGVATENNTQAFRRGRQSVADPGAFRAAVARGQGEPAPSVPAGEVDVETLSLDDLLRRRVPELEAYQDKAYARAYLDFVEEVRAAEAATVPGASAVAEAVARYLYKFMAYKDEYEVARLWLDPALTADLEQRFGAGARINYRLHPPVLRALGLKKKVSLGPWFRPVFAGLYSMRRLRGTPVDPFGYTAVRRTERRLIDEYRELVRTLLAELTPENHAEIAEIVALPDIVRGYEEIKMANVEAYRTALREKLQALSGENRELAAAG
jgi:indolepyruvate ferredoxin oxidoreductase